MTSRRFLTALATLALLVTLLPAMAAAPSAAQDPSGPDAALTVSDGLLSLDLSGDSTALGEAPTAQATATASSVDGVPDATGDWPTGNRNRARTGNAAWEEFITVPAGSKWTTKTSDKVQLNPAIVDDIAYFGASGTDQRAYAVNLQTGIIEWDQPLPGSVLSSPVVDDGWVYFAGSNGRIYRYAARNGQLTWTWPPTTSNAVGGIIGAMAIHDGVLYAGSLDGNLYAIDATTSNLLWSAPTPEAITAGVTIGDGTVYVMSGANEWITAFDIATRSQDWQRQLYTWTNPNTLGTDASYSGSKVFFTGLDSKLYILDAITGTTLASPGLGSTAQNTPVLAAERVFVGTNNGRVLAFDRNGTQLWTRTLTNPGIVSSPVFAAGLVFASNTDGAVYALDANDGTPKWQFVTGGPIFAAPSIVSNHILFGSDDTNLYGLVPGLPDNRSFSPPPPRSHTYGIRADIVYSWDPVATSTGNYVYQTTDAALPSRGVPIGFARTYNSLDAATDGPLGYGWAFNAGATLTTDTTGAVIRWGDGHTDTYTGTGPTYTSPPDVHDTLTAAAAGGWDLTTVDYLVYHFDPNGRLATITDRSGNQTTMGYDPAGQVTSMTDATGHTLTIGYNAAGKITSVTDPLGRSWTYTYTPAGELATAADNDGNTWRYTYDSGHRLTTLTDPDNNLVIDNAYDTEGRATVQTDSKGGQWTYTYNATNTIVTDPLGHATTYEFDTNYRTTAVTNHLGHTSRWVYDERSNLIATVDPTGRSTQYRYDDDGRITAALDPLGHKTQFDYDPDGNLTTVTNLKGYQASFDYDPAGRLTSTTSPEGVTASITYRPDGQIDTVTTPAGTTQYGYDTAGMLQTITDPLGRTSQVTVDAAGQITAATDPLGRATGYRYDPAGRLDQITDPAGHTISYGYDNTGRLTAYTDQNNHTTTYTYDSRGLLTATTDPLGRTDTIAYDAALRRTSTTNARGQTITYTYDAADRLTGIDYPGTTPDVTYTYDAAGRPLTMTDGTGTTTYTYDTGGRLTQEARPLANATLHYRYDTLNRRTELELRRNGGLTARNTYTYDGEGRLSVLTDSAGGDTRFAYDPAGRLAQLAHPNGMVTDYAYDAASQLTDITNNRVATATGTLNLVSAWNYTYDLAGQRTASTRITAGLDPVTSTYGYDQLGRLTSATSTDAQAALGSNATWTYDPAGNRTTQAIAGAVPTTTYTYDAADQLTGDGTHTYSYDPDGNLTRRRTTLGGLDIAAYTWDPANRITSQTTGGTTTTYGYDGANRRITKTDPAGTNTYIYDGYDLLEEISTAITGGDAVETTAAGTVLNRITAAGTAYLHADANANITELSDETGLTVTRYGYSPWGNRNTIGNTATDPYLNRHGFAGATGVRDDTGGLIDMRNRMYDPSVGAFISRDPLEHQTREPYLYAGANPLSYLDPYGLSKCGRSWTSPGDWVDCVANPTDATDPLENVWDRTGGQVATAVSENVVQPVWDARVDITRGASYATGVAGVFLAPFSGGASLGLTLASLGLGVTSQALDNSPCRAERIVGSAVLGLFGAGVSGAFVAGGKLPLAMGADAGVLAAGLLPIGCPAVRPVPASSVMGMAK